ncbi:glycoside hydrolase family 127 protein [Micromonospora sp. KC606]|uniref:glycoside hydrolase family 127 protein n=1 Tax=Micromonospora sp. KC606 TaxID=2530379 RepID=UPI00105049B0|nr:beta-L-arabinofuranosidase domain-containing protein [Micromonospora sp. KC606]TDC83819.1 glycoside hydrolase family 127 protein [Micromonospora sp. KC606]
MTNRVHHGPTAPTSQAIAALRPLPADAVRLDREGLLGAWQDRNTAATLPHCVDQLDARGNLNNLRRVTGDYDGAFAGYWFADTDIYKTLEAAWWAGGFASFVAEIAHLLEKAQDADGYLMSYFQVEHRDRQWKELPSSHEMYSAGHLIQAGVAAARSAPDDPAAQQLLAVARHFADLLVERFSEGTEEALDGHPQVETALVELYRVTGHRPYLDLAARFIDLRGHGLLGPESRFHTRHYYQDHAPFRAADEVTGHAVRQVYLAAGAVDVAVETGDTELLLAAERLWESAIATKTYLTGGQGSRHRDEAFGDPYELPPDRAYAETCAAIGSFHWSWRLLLATGKVRYADEMERLLYNGIAASTSLDGTAFFYSNPLQVRTGHDGSDEDAPGQRLNWYSCACCPPNLARLMASLHTYAATGGPEGLQLHLYTAGTFSAGGRTVRIETAYPWDETVTVTVTETTAEPWTLALRVPNWCVDARLTLDGMPVPAAAHDGYVHLSRTWLPGDRVELVLAMPVRLVTAHPRVDAVRGTAAVTRGPVVYCLEHADMPDELDGFAFEDVELDSARPATVVHNRHSIAPVALHTPVRARDAAGDAPYQPLNAAAPPATLTATVPAIPYFLWANRAPGPMRVWIPLAPQVRQA